MEKSLHWLLVAAFCVVSVEGKPVNCTRKILSFPLLRQQAPVEPPYVLMKGPGPKGVIYRDPIPIYNYSGPILYGAESVIYTIEVAVGLQRFNLTLDTNAQAPVLFSKGYVAPNASCLFGDLGERTWEDGDAPRNFFDRELSESFHDTGKSFSGWGLYRYPYVSRSCGVSIGGTENFQGIWANDTFDVEPPYVLMKGPGPKGVIYRDPIPIYNYSGPILYGAESVIYTIEVAVGLQRFNLTLDTNAQAPVLFSKGYVAPNASCLFGDLGERTWEDGDAPRNFFDRELSESFHDTGKSFSGWGLYRYPYVSRSCGVSIGGTENFQGIWANDTFDLAHSPLNTFALDSFTVPKVPFILANQTNFLLNKQWRSDGVFPLGAQTHQALSRILSGVGGKPEVSLWLNGPRAKPETPAPGGEITLGGKDTRNCGDQWTTLPSANLADWSISLHSVQVGDNVTSVYNRERSSYARITLATPFLEVPTSKLYRILGQNHHIVNCSLIDSMPGITINIGSGFESIYYTVPAKEFVVRLPRPLCAHPELPACETALPPLCALLIVEKLPQASSFMPWGDGYTPDPDDVWVIGSQFLPKRCVHLDYANGEMSFADPLERD